MLLSDSLGGVFPQFNANSAFEFYESIRHRLPCASFPTTSKTAPDLLSISDQFDVLVFDAFGVLNVGDDSVEGAAQCIHELRKHNKQLFVLTNAASYPSAFNVLKFKTLGFNFTESEIVSSRLAAEQAIGVCKFDLWGAASANQSTIIDLPVNAVKLGDEPEIYERVDAFLLLSTMDWNSCRQEMMEDAIGNRPRPVVVANPDVVAPRETHFSTEPGFSGHQIANRFGLDVEFHGKPYPSVFEIVRNRLPGEVKPEKICMIGDTLHTDIIGGAANGWSTVLVTNHGMMRGLNTATFIKKSGIVPDWVIPTI